ncbi:MULTISPECIES: SDR family NAD(P)-dependent oxidoreductase [Pseudomonas]|uniref:SDR family oxidoreductase n=1 Tax=Pseudomonas nitroreducens TaxID=46680 RepID=A0ABS0KNS2_PSENT|nr:MULTISPECIES: SDR family oxidoreductase [Pseudomonas]MBG6289623.1 SDR family oxidoreductase [Pseudomonas nitroreducens]MCJ1877743.1 SDR family oxidoreductase [Pseudomonas nitroreducens]MCJ1897109.1 SDR family oxidoreductase [Pseudomonas nitroreducens]MDG9857643.1 SDR family oxidoreductase [Pseudomonas nitroreducens]MDH1076760.1 SDR family oxidoreductase [Pseudomonas nitroreducens]
MNAKSELGRALITGASSGIGATYAQRFAAQGYDLLLVARDQQRLEALAARLGEEYGVSVDVLKADLTRREDRARVEARLAEDSSISLLLNNAGVAINGTLLETDLDRLESMIELNVTATARLAGAAAKAFAGRGRGTIINVASVLALAPELFNGSYSATKAFVLNLTQSMQQELAPQGLRIQAVLPGATRTEIWDRAGTDISALPAEMLMDVNHMVDAALAGLAQGEVVTLPALPDAGEFDAFTAARLKLAPNLSRSVPAQRYGVAVG